MAPTTKSNPNAARKQTELKPSITKPKPQPRGRKPPARVGKDHEDDNDDLDELGDTQKMGPPSPAPERPSARKRPATDTLVTTILDKKQRRSNALESNARALKRPGTPLESSNPKKPQISSQSGRAKSKGKTPIVKKNTVFRKEVPKPSEKPPAKAPTEPPIGRQAFNIEYARYPEGEIESNRAEHGQHTTWVVQHGAVEGQGKILFNSPDSRYGGPFAFLSNSFHAKVDVPQLMENFTFRHAEHAMVFAKSRALTVPDERITKRIDPAQSSKKLWCVFILNTEMPVEDMAAFAMKWDHLEEDEPDWWLEFRRLWEIRYRPTLKVVIAAKFEQNPDVKMLLMMTGEYDLYEASSNSVRGIGHLAHLAFQRKKWHQNVNGQVLMEVRSEIRKRGPQWPKEYAFDYFRALDLNHEVRQHDKGVDADSPPADEDQAKRAWLDQGGDELKQLMDKQWFVENDLHGERERMVEAFYKQFTKSE